MRGATKVISDKWRSREQRYNREVPHLPGKRHQSDILLQVHENLKYLPINSRDFRGDFGLRVLVRLRWRSLCGWHITRSWRTSPSILRRREKKFGKHPDVKNHSQTTSRYLLLLIAFRAMDAYAFQTQFEQWVGMIFSAKNK